MASAKKSTKQKGKAKAPAKAQSDAKAKAKTKPEAKAKPAAKAKAAAKATPKPAAKAKAKPDRPAATPAPAPAPSTAGPVALNARIEAPPLTFLDPVTRNGFKAVLVFPDGKPEKTAWAAALKVARAGKVDAGPVAAVYVIVPLPEHAAALAPTAAKAGLAGVLYMGDGGQLLQA